MKKNWKNCLLQSSIKSLSRKIEPALRIIFDGRHSGFWNMAQDEALLTVGEETKDCVPPTLRFFSWAEPTLSVGRFQRTDNLNFSYLKKKAFPWSGALLEEELYYMTMK